MRAQVTGEVLEINPYILSISTFIAYWTMCPRDKHEKGAVCSLKETAVLGGGVRKNTHVGLQL